MKQPGTEINPVKKKSESWRNLIGYWILGLCNNYGYVVMLSAAHDILHTQFNIEDGVKLEGSARECNAKSTGAILLADIIPALTIKLTAPFLPVMINIRVLLAIILSAAGFLLVAFAPAEWVAITGVVCMSLSSGLGEVTFLTYSSYFHKNVVSAWSSGTGGAGIIGAISYAGLTTLGLSAVATLLIMLVVPVIMGVAFWIIIEHPKRRLQVSNTETELTTNCDDFVEDGVVDKPVTKSKLTFKEKVSYLRPLMKYMIPVGLVYFFEYFINQGLFELINFENIWLDHAAQYRWLQVDYQIGVFISRSSVNLIQINKIWVMSLLQFFNVIIFLCEVLFYFSPTIWIVFGLTLWEGLLGGAAYVNTFYKISKEVPEDRKEFSMGVTSLADSIGIALAGFLSMPAHNALCRVSVPTRPSL